MLASIRTELLKTLRVAFVAVLAFCVPALAEAQNLNLAWDQSTTPEVVGYTVHVGVTPGSYGQSFDVGAATTFTFTQAIPGTRYYFAVRAYDAENRTSPPSNEVSWKINVGPTLAEPGSQLGAVAAPASLQLSATDDGDVLTYSATGLPPGLSINPSTGRISGTPTTGGAYTVGVTVSDGPLSSSRTFDWTVNPRLSVTSLTSNVASPQNTGTGITFTAAGSNGVGPYEYKFLRTLGGTTTVVRNWSSSSSFTWTPAEAGTYSISVWMRSAGSTVDVAEGSASRSFLVTRPLAVTSFTSDLPTPQTVGTAITLSATVSGGVAPYQFKFWVSNNNGASWTVLRDWNTSASYTWTPPTANSGYQLFAWARSAGVTADVAEAAYFRTFSVTAPAPARLTAFTSNLPSPQAAGTAVTLSAAASGGVAPYQFKFWVSSNSGASWTVLRDWGTSASYAWTPTVANSNYQLFAWVRSAGATADAAEGAYFRTFSITGPTAPPPARVTRFTSNVPSPQSVGTPITLSAAAADGVAPYQFKFWVSSNNGASWTVLRDWNTSASYTWSPTAAASYQLFVWVRSAGSTANSPEGAYFWTYTVTGGTAPTPARLTAFTSSLPSPQRVGTPITLAATASGGVAPYQFKFWISINNGASWTVLRDWDTSATSAWTPTSSNSSYQLFAWVRSAGSTANAAEGSYFRTFTITDGPAPPPAQLTSFTTSLPSPQRFGTSITLSATATGGVAPYQYKFWVSSNNGATWTVVRDWSTSASYTWTPAVGNTHYQLFVWVRSAGATADAAEHSYFRTYTIQ